MGGGGGGSKKVNINGLVRHNGGMGEVDLGLGGGGGNSFEINFSTTNDAY